MNLIGSIPSSLDSRPIPENTHYVSSDADVEAALGSSRIIPSNTNIAVIIDKSFSLTKPFLKQADSSIFLYSDSSDVTLTYTGTGAMIQMDGAVIGDRTQLYNLNFVGNFGNNLLAVEDSEFFTTFDCTIAQFAKVGFLKGTVVIWRTSGFFACFAGVDFINCPTVTYKDGGSNSFGAAPELTAFSFITNTRMDVVFRDSQYVDTAKLANLIFIDPNMPADGSVSISGSGVVTIAFEQMFQEGTDETVTAVADNGNNKLRCTLVGHTQVNNTYALLSGFAESTYNITALITVIDANTFDVEEITFVSGSDSGTINRASLTAKDPRVVIRDNAGQQDSMYIGGWFHTTNIASTTIQDGTFGPLNLATDGGVTPFVENERFVVFNVNEGVFQYIGLEDKTLTLITVLSMERTGTTRTYNLRYAIDRGEVDTVAVALGGSGYTEGDAVTLIGQTSGATNATATVNVTAGAITAINIVSGGNGYVEGETLDVEGGTGSGATGTATILGFVALPTSMERTQEISSTARDTTLNQEVILQFGDKIRIEIEGSGTTDPITVIFASMDVKG